MLSASDWAGRNDAIALRNVVVIPQWDAVDLEIGAVLAHANCWRKFAISCNSSGLKFAALHESAFGT
jgi:hypothetical protein